MPLMLLLLSVETRARDERALGHICNIFDELLIQFLFGTQFVFKRIHFVTIYIYIVRTEYNLCKRDLFAKVGSVFV